MKDRAITLDDVLDVVFSVAHEEGLSSINITRLHKILYLIDVEAKRHLGKTITGLKWVFHHYGPYSPELKSYLEDTGAIIESSVTSQNKPLDMVRYKFRHFKLKTPEHRIAYEIAKEWMLASLSELLDYVYDTEPMLEVQKRGEILNFDTVKPQKVKKIRFTPQEIKELKAIGKKIKSILDELPITQPEPFEIDNPTIKMMELWEKEAKQLEVALNKLEKEKIVFRERE